MLTLLFLAWSSAAPVTDAPPTGPSSPVPSAGVEVSNYLSEVVRSGLRPEMFDRPIKPKANLVALFGTEDYPLEAMRNEEEGIVAAVLKVGRDGRVADCIIAGSSGSPSLDAQTCRILWARARFEPARDRQGRPVESAIRQRIRWMLPSPDPTPIKPWSARFTVEFVRDGGLIACRLETKGALKADDDQCVLASDMWRAALSNLRANAGYERATFVHDMDFALGERVTPSLPPDGVELISRQVVRLAIDSEGKALQCRVVETEGAQPPVAGCDDLLGEIYEKPDIKVGAVEATLVRTAYMGQRAGIDRLP